MSPPSRKSPEHDLAPGTRFGRYEIVRRIGTGGMATVYEALQTDIQRRVGLKLLHPYHALRDDVVQRFVNEARIASRIEHPHVLAITDMGVEQDVPFMAMDLLEGEELWAVMHRERALPITRVADLLVPVISAVATAHEKGILHRDIKPENIFLARRRPRGEHPVLLDFGISKVREASGAGITASGEVLGTPPYMAPEQVEFGMRSFDALSDQYALGVVLYEAVTATLPFPEDGSILSLMRRIQRGGAPPPSTHRPGIPEAFDALVGRAMAVKPADRFPSVHELGRALLPFAGPLVRTVWGDEFGLPVTEALPVSDPPPPRASAPPRRTAPPPLDPGALRIVPCLAGCDDADLADLLAAAGSTRLRAGDVLFERGTAGASLWLLVSGEIELQGSSAELRGVARPGSMLGAMAAQGRSPRPLTAVARTDATLIELRRDSLEMLPELAPQAAACLLEQLTVDAIRRLRALDARLADATDDGPRGAAELRRLAAAAAEWSLAIDGTAGPRRRG